MPSSRKSATCELSHVLSPSINFLLLKCCDCKPVLQVGKQVVTFIVVLCILLRISDNTMRDFHPRNTLCTLNTALQVVVVQSKIRVVRKLVKQLPVEMLQQCLSRSICMLMCIIMGNTTPDVSIPHLSFWMVSPAIMFCNALLALLWSLVAWIPPTVPLSCSRKKLPSAFLQAVKVKSKVVPVLN
jgi:hypothetical protein